MAASFYSRYVPPSAEKNEVGVPLKRKRESDIGHATSSAKISKGEAKPKKKKNKNTIVPVDASVTGKGLGSSSPHRSSPDRRAQTDTQGEETAERNVSAKKASNGPTEAHRSNEDAKIVAKSSKWNVSPDTPGSESPTTEKKKVKKKEKTNETHKPDDNPINAESSEPTKHAKIISKFERSQSAAQRVSVHPKDEEMTKETNENEVVSHGLEPLPQPAPAPEAQEPPSYSTLPSWLAEPYTVPSDLKRDFSSLGVYSKTLSALQNKGFTEAFPIQSAVMTLLSKGPDYHEGDICISAATGSGKTLAYTLPLVADIEPSPLSRLRGLIVVPTRELVKQARESCELCASGTGLRIGTAVGSTALKEEQQQLMRQDQVYDPVSYKKRNEQSMRADDWAKFNFQDYLEDVEEFQNTLPDHVSTSSPNVDILICTPGRLVDHIRSTKGFNLEHVQWLIIDEADRLLNESFQEWVETVMPAFESQQDMGRRGSARSFLHGLGKSMNRQKLRKIILSATMTNDITKLNSLRLQNPKLVVMNDRPREAHRGNEEKEIETMISETPDNNIRLPSTLNELYAPVGDGSEKPLFLLKLLLHHLKILDNRPNSGSGRSSSVSSSDSSSSSGDSSDDDSSSSISSASSSTAAPTSITNRTQTSVLIFTKSSESAARLSRLLCLLHPPLTNLIGTLTKSNKSSSVRRTLSSYRQGKLSIIIATDRASRGLDLSSLSHVISYDIPSSLTSYIHRIGRTARAGREGSAWTLVAHREGRWFSNEIMKGPVERLAGERVVKKVNVQLDEDAELRERYSDALMQLERQVVNDTRRPNRTDRPEN